jgi:PAS domain S-box-containing protein
VADSSERNAAEESARLRAIINAALDYAIFTMDTEGRVETWSPGAVAVFRWTADEMIGQHFAKTFTPEDRARDVPRLEMETAAARGSAPDVRWHARKGGARVFIDGTARALRDEQGALRGFLKIGQDVTQRRQMEQSLLESESRYRALVDNISDYAIFLVEPDGRVSEWTLGAHRIMGYEAKEAVGLSMATFYAGDTGEVARTLEEARTVGRAERTGWRVRKGGERYYSNEIITAITDSGGQLTGFTVVTRDLTARQLAEERAMRMRDIAERDILRRQLLAAEEAERRRFARELHDEAGQHLTALSLGLQSLSDVAPPGSEIDRRAAKLRDVVATLSAELHALAQRLRPKALDDFGLVPALTGYVEEWSRTSAIPVDIHARLDGPRLLPALETAVYRIVQEALTNIARHSEATRASVIVERRDDSVVAIIEDNGRGFDTTTPPRTGVRTALGLRGIIERATILGGMAEIESSPNGGGTTLYVRIPMGEMPETRRSTQRA